MVRTWLEVTAAVLLSLVAAVCAAPAMPETAAQALVVLAVLAAAGAPAGHRAMIAVPASGVRVLGPRRRAGGVVPLVLAGRTTDVVHHPLRPRAPGLV